MDDSSQIEQDKLEQEQKREYDRLTLQETVERQRISAADNQGEVDRRAKVKSEKQVQVKDIGSKVKKGKKEVKTLLLILRIIFTSGTDLVAWVKLAKAHPLLAMAIAVGLILLIIIIFIGLIFLFIYMYCTNFSGVVTWLASLITDTPDFCANFN